MKLTYKLVLGFLGTSLTVGAIGLMVFRQGLQIQFQRESARRSFMAEIKNVTEVTIAFSRLTTLSQYALYAQFQAPGTQTRQQILQQSQANSQATIQQILNRLAIAKLYYRANQNPHLENLAIKSANQSQDQLPLVRLEALKQAVQIYADQTHQFFELLRKGEVNQAKLWIDQTLEPSRKNKLLPLLQAYQDDLESRSLSQGITENWIFSSTRQYLLTILTTTIVLAMFVGGLIAYSIYRSISRLEEAAIAVGKGDLDFQITVNSQDELGLLAQSFNQMISDLSQITVSKTYLDNILDSMSESLMVLDAAGILIKVNKATQEILGYGDAELLGHSIYEWLAVNSQPLSGHPFPQTALVDLLKRDDIAYCCQSGQLIPISCSTSPIQDPRQQEIGLILVARNITELKQAQDKLLHNATHDALTHLPNRISFQDRITKLLDQVKSAPDYLFAVMFLDLDRFKLVNDSLGHVAGDQLLMGIAQRVRACVRKQDMVARLGGDEFAVLLDGIDSITDAQDIAERIQAQLALPFAILGQEVYSSTSIGITLSNQGYQSLDAMIRDADTAMYQAKRLGKARYAVFDHSMYVQATKCLKLENDLRRAISRQELYLLYQPIVQLHTYEIIGFEALVRWHHPDWGLIFPSEFIPIAEETNLIQALGQWILVTACTQMNLWQNQTPRQHPLEFISINVSLQQLQDPGFLGFVNQTLAQTQLSAQTIQLEITESVFDQGFHDVITTLTHLQQRGLKLAIDDFGTGYSSLARLHRYPIDTLKIDKAFVEGVDQQSDKLETARLIVHLASMLGLSTIAEGIETQCQLETLRDLGCGYGQGYLFSSPLSAVACTAMLRQGLLFESGEILPIRL